MDVRLHARLRFAGFMAILPVAVLSLAACTPNLAPHVKDMRLTEAVPQSSLIIIGQVSSVAFTKRLSQTPDEKRWILRLVKADVIVENVLKGDVRQPKLTFYYYYPEYGFSLPSVNLIAPYDRAIFFLERDHNAFRSVNDVYASCIHLATGSHPGLNVGQQKTPEQAITEACILPGSKGDMDKQRWPLWIAQGASVGERLIGAERTIELLRSLERYPDYRVRNEACLAASGLSPKKLPCLDKLEVDRGFDPDFDGHVRKQIHDLQVRRHYEFGDPMPPKLPQPPPPGAAEVRLDMKAVRVWWPW